MINNAIFKERLGCIVIQNNITISAFPNLFYTRAFYLLNSVALSQYVNVAYSNWDNYNQHNDFIFNTKNNNHFKSESENLN